MTKISTIKKAISVYVAVSLLVSSVLPARLNAMTGPAAPEFSSFESVSTNNMISEFSGDFGYNLPLLEIPGVDGGGYALSLSYKSGTSPEEDPSWVGCGWTLSPGAILRSKNGFPDDANGVEMTSFNTIPINWTIGLGLNAGVTLEGFSLSASIGETLLLQYNNKMGFSYTAIPNIGVAAGYGLVSLNLALQDGGGSLSAQVNPAAAMNFVKKADAKEQHDKAKTTTERQAYVASRGTEKAYSKALGKGSQQANAFISYATENSSRNTNVSAFTAGSFKMQLGVQYEPVGVPIGLGADLFGTFSFQAAVPETTYTCYGYLYSANATDKDVLMDCYTEKDQGFNKRDYYSSIPFARPDQFILMGEGLSGGFRAFSKKVGHFRTNEVENETVIVQTGVDIMAGLDLGIGGSLNVGYHTVGSGDWDDEGENDDYNFSNSLDESFYMSFMMDPSQYMTFGGDEKDLEAQAFSLEKTCGTPGLKSYIPKHPSSLVSEVNNVTNLDEYTADNNDRVSRSSQVIFHTNKQMTTDKDGASTPNYYNRYSRPEEDHEMNYLSRTADDQIGEFIVYNNTGNRYVYGLPVYNKNESSLSYDISTPSKDYLVVEDIVRDTDPLKDLNYKKVGDFTATAYASSYLLTNITSPNYIDRTMNGPTSDDFGGWTKFNYNKKYGDKNDAGDNEWYHWRSPYNGLYNNPGSLTDDSDDMGAFSSGDKEMYYLENIETKTHIATFYKSSRLDGIEADDDESAAKSFSAKGTNKIDRLDSIYLYSKDASGAAADVIKRIYFNYDYSLMDGQPNSTGTKGSATDSLKAGKLTLKKVWFEYGEVRNAKISPYEFSYSYPVDGTYPTKYADLDNYGAYSSSQQNPDYNKFNIDRWGNYQYNGSSRSGILNPWVDQNPDDANFDPAAWQLKCITLPTGGQIHVQYEQDDYLYVQDRKAMAMVSIQSVDDGGDGTGDGAIGTLGDKFYLNLDDLDISTDADKAALVSQLQKQFVDGDPEKIFFKFLYSLLVSSADLTTCGSDYISGYVDVAAVGSDATGVYLQLGSSTSGSDEILDDDEEYSVPRDVCVDFYDKTRIGNINSKDASCQIQSIAESSTDESGAEEAIYNLLAMVSDNILVEDHSSLCLDVDENNSYLRIPVLNSKLGGGLRVKRLLMYDAGIESNDKTLNGKEYVYQNADGQSSGVACNEPSQGRNENALITYLDIRKDSEWYQKVISGEDLEQYEGPIGEGVLPGASVGYSRVVAKNIHDDENTNDGFSISEFYTTYDYPFDKDYSYTDADDNKVKFNGVDITEMNQETDWLPIYTIIYNRTVSNIWSSQGYRFIVNDMNGKPRRDAVYSGPYIYANTPDSIQLVSGMEYTYYEPLEPVKVVNRWEWANESDIVPEYRVLGKQMDVVTESRAVKDHLDDLTIEVDVTIGIWGPVVIPYVSGMGYINQTINELYTHVTNKVIYAPTQLKTIRKYQDGIYVDTYNEFFDANTAEAMVNITNDGFNNLSLNGSAHDGRYVNFSFPASHYYNGMGVRSNTDEYHVESPNCFYKNNDGTNTYLEYDVTTCGSSCAMDVFTPGDLVVLTSTTGVVELYNIGEIVGNTAELLPNGDFYYNTTDYAMSDVMIARTSRTNQLGEKVGGLTTYGGYPEVTNVAISPGLITARERVAAALNTMAASSGSVTVSLSFPDVYIMDGDSCVPISTTATTNRYRETIYYNDFDTVINCYPYNCIGGTSTTTTTSNGIVAGGTTTTTTMGTPPDNDRYVWDYKTNSWKCWNCDTTIVTTKKQSSIRKIDVTIGSCTITFSYVDGYKFYIDDATGELMYGNEAEPCDAVRVDCFDFCPDEYASVELDGVVACSSTWLSDEWDLTTDLKDVFDIPGTTTPDLNEYEYGAKGKWHSAFMYDYNTTLSKITSSNAKVWNAGIYDDFTVFNNDYEEANDSIWTKLTTTTKMSPNAIPLEEKNALDIYSVMKSGYNFTVPYLSAVNSIYENVLFEGFETAVDDGTSINGEDDYEISTITYDDQLATDTAHTGEKSIRAVFTKSTSSSGSGMFVILTTNYENELQLQPIVLNDQVIDEGVSVKFWMKSDKTLTELSLKYKKFVPMSGLVSTSTGFTKIAQTGEWTLYEAKITDFGSKITTLASSVTPSIYVKYSGLATLSPTAPKLYLDDIRMQPLDAQVTAYVYDPVTLKLIASFDDQHFGLLYQYDKAGKLVRKLKETVEGIKTFEETQYNIPKNSSRPY